jgi:hypothetical protein
MPTFLPARAARGKRACGLTAVCDPVTACAHRGPPVPAILPKLPEKVMNEKSHVSLEQHACLVCGVAFDTGNLLLDKRLRAHGAPHGDRMGLCPEHQQWFTEGLVALVEWDPLRSGPPSGNLKLGIADSRPDCNCWWPFTSDFDS